MYTLIKFGAVTLPTGMTEYTASPVPGLSLLTPTAAGIFDGNGEARRRQLFPLPLTYKTTVAEDSAGANRSTLDTLRALVGTRNILYRQANDNGVLQRCTAELVAMPYPRPYSNHSSIHEITLEFQQLSPWLGTLNGTGWTFDSGVLFDSGRFFDEGIAPTTLSLAVTLLTITNNGNLPSSDVLMTVKAGSEALQSLTVWNFTSNCRFYWAGTLLPGAELQIDAAACSVKNAGADEYNQFQLDDPFHKNEHWLEFLAGANRLSIVRFGGSNDSTISFVFPDRWA